LHEVALVPAANAAQKEGKKTRKRVRTLHRPMGKAEKKKSDEVEKDVWNQPSSSRDARGGKRVRRYYEDQSRDANTVLGT